MREPKFDSARDLSRIGDSVSTDENDALLTGRLLHWADEGCDGVVLLKGKPR